MASSTRIIDGGPLTAGCTPPCHPSVAADMTDQPYTLSHITPHKNGASKYSDTANKFTYIWLSFQQIQVCRKNGSRSKLGISRAYACKCDFVGRAPDDEARLLDLARLRTRRAPRVHAMRNVKAALAENARAIAQKGTLEPRAACMHAPRTLRLDLPFIRQPGFCVLPRRLPGHG